MFTRRDQAIEGDHNLSSVEFVPPEDTPGYQLRLINELEGRLGAALGNISHLQQRLTQLEVFAHKQSQNQEVAKEIAERQTRYSALDLAIKASGPGAGGDVMTALAEGFLTWLRGEVH
jgi:hypothetical protein